MSLCVPEWDGSGAVPPTNAFYGNGKVEFVTSRKSHYSEVPDQDAVEVGWNDYDHIAMQGHNGKCTKAQWQYISARSNGDDGVTPSKPKSAEAAPVTVENADDEMVSWLQYPLEPSLERSYCSEFFGELPPSNPQLMKESFGFKPAVRSSLPMNDNRAAIAEAAMKMGAGRAAGLLPQTGVEAFSKVRTLQSPQQQTRGPQNGSNSAPKSNPMLPPRMQPIAPSQSPPGTRLGNGNFSHFSFHPTFVKTSLRSQAVPNAAQPKHPVAEASTSTGSCIAESASGPRQEVHVQAGGEQCNGFDSSRWQSAPPKDGDCVTPGGECKSGTPAADQEMCRQSGVTRDASEKGASCVTQQPDVQEPTITCSSGGYGISAERAKEAATNTKRKSSEKEDAECHSEDGEGESMDTKKPLTARGSTTKRSRAAEVHNQSERRRRDRINEKMRALQELIPNSNKTDKASMLDEAIEYLKMLQLQLQMMSMRTGMTLPPMVVPSGHMQQHMQMPHMGAMPPMGMGMGMMPMGLPMGMMDMGVSGPGRAGMPMPSHAGPSMNMASSSTVVDMHDLRYQAAGGVPMDPYNAYLARQHQPMQINQTLGMDKYSAYMLQQHQQHQQQLPQSQQHQQHHIHQQGPHMNGGPPL